MVRNKAAHSVSGHKAKSEYRRHKFNELDHENLPSLGALESCAGAKKRRRHALRNARTLCIASKQAPFNCINKIHPENGEQTPAPMTGPSHLCVNEVFSS